MHKFIIAIIFIFSCACFTNSTFASNSTQQGVSNPIVVLESPYSFENTIRNIKTAIVGNNFRLIREQKLDHGLVSSEDENPAQHVIYFCNFNLLNKALAIDTRVGLFLPCRITVVKAGNKVLVYTANPKYLSNMLENSALDNLCNRMGSAYLDIIEEAIF